MSKEEADLVLRVLRIAEEALRSCHEGYDHEGGSFQYYDEDKVKEALRFLGCCKVFEKA